MDFTFVEITAIGEDPQEWEQKEEPKRQLLPDDIPSDPEVCMQEVRVSCGGARRAV